ncbi:conserved hypothetical protein [Citreicella sp. SE45]|nr:conserved hypothetical protein [Citreicella sp. SE45]
MSRRKPYKRHKKGAGRFVQLTEYMQATAAWRDLKPGPRALYVELKRRFTGSNNGEIFLSYRDAAKLLNVHFNTVGAYFAALEDHGFIRMTVGPHLGPSGIGQAAKWALEEMPTQDGRPATKGFVTWQSEKKPVTGTVTRRTGNRDMEQRQEARPVLKIVTGGANE